MSRKIASIVVQLLCCAVLPVAAGAPGYYRQPALRGATLVFAAEGDLWKVDASGGTARRLTSHPGDEADPAISPDGRTLAFTAEYEGPTEVYTMPLDGGLPRRRTWGSGGVGFVGWTPAGDLLYSTERYSTLPNRQLVRLSLDGDAVAAIARVPLAQAADGVHDDAERTLFFTRLAFQGSHTKRYRGGTAQQIWRFDRGADEAVPLTADYPGTSKRPMWWGGRVWFVSDRDGTMNLWSMDRDGGDLRQHTRHAGWDVRSPCLDAGRIAYRLGADLRLFDVATASDRAIPLELDSDFDQTRENWVDKPLDYLTAVHTSHDGERVVLTARGRVFIAPRKQGRFVAATPVEGQRWREARFMPDGKHLVALSDASGEVELWRLPANGVGTAERLTDDGEVLRWDALPAPDGKRIAHHDKDQQLWVYDVDSGENRLVERNTVGGPSDLAWSPDSRWLAYVAPAANSFSRVKIWSAESGATRAVTSDRYQSHAPAWSADGKWLYVLSERNLRSIVGSPWGGYQPEPYLDKTTKVFHIALQPGLRSPFAPADELQPAAEPGSEPGDDDGSKADTKADTKAEPVQVEIDFDGLETRLSEVPVPPGNYAALGANDAALFFLSRATGGDEQDLVAVKIGNEKIDVEPLVREVRGYELSGNGKRLLVRKGDALYLIAAKPEKAELDEAAVNLSAWNLSVVPREEWRQIFDDAWRLERDYFYDRDMHGVDWAAVRERHRPLLDRVTTRDELNDLIAQMVGELSALHIFVRGGDRRNGPDEVAVASLGARLIRDAPAGGYRVEHVYLSDPDEPWRAAPLTRPGVAVTAGDVILSVNGVAALSVPEVGALLRQQADRQVLLRVASRRGGDPRDVIVEPIELDAAEDLRYHEWEYTRREIVEERSDGEFGYVHLRAMGGRNYTEWATHFYPVFNRKGLIIDVRHNRGGNIDSWILGRLLRRAWFHWNQRVGQSPLWNMQWAFRGHVVVLCNERTASDGEAFTEGIRRLGIGTIIGTRTWGGEIWLSSSNHLADGGIATAAEYGVYSPEGEWLIEGWGVEPDIEVDNLPHATFNGEDAQLDAAIEFLKNKLVEEPVETPPVPRRPDKSFDYPGASR